MNEKLKFIRNLLEKRRARHKEKCFVVEGPHLVEEARGRVQFVVYSRSYPIVKKLEEEGVLCYKVSQRQFEELSEVETPQGVLAVVRQFEYQFRDILKTDKTLVVYCLGVQDPGNLGTIIRSADALGATGVVLSKGTVDLYNPKVIRSTMGSLFHIPIVQTNDDRETIRYLKEKNVKIIATSVKAKNYISEVDLGGPVAILVGNEAAGLPVEILDLADETVKIPMPGKAESLNVAMATTVILYEILRQRMKK